MKKLISLVSLFCLSVFLPLSVMGEPIDREAVVKRHRVCTTGTLLKSPAQVGLRDGYNRIADLRPLQHPVRLELA